MKRLGKKKKEEEDTYLTQTLEESDDIDVSDINPSGWIVKIPQGIYDKWNARGGGSVVGEISVTDKKEKKLNIEKDEFEVRQVRELKIHSDEDEFLLESRKLPNPLYIFKTEKSSQFSRKNDVQVSINSTVSKIYHATQQNVLASQSYRDRIKKITKMRNKKNEKMHFINDLSQSTGLMAKAGGREKLKELTSKKKKKIKEKMAKNDLVELLFSMFQRKKRWMINELANETNQPLGYLRKILPEVATKNLSGFHRNSWEMNTDYALSNEKEKDEEEWE